MMMRFLSWLACVMLACMVLIAAAPPLNAAPANAPSGKRIALTFDDIPRQAGAYYTPDERTRALIASLRKAKVKQAGFFVTPGNLDTPDGVGGERRIKAYVRAGHVIANHSFSHQWLMKTPADQYIADIDKASAWLKGRRGLRNWYRYPYLDEGRRDLVKRAAVREALSARGLSNGYVTVDNYDWHIDALANAAKTEKKVIDEAALRDLYVETLVGAANFYDKIAREALGRQPAQVMLLHETDLNARMIADVVAGLRNDGWEIITIDEAYRDPIAAREPDGWFTNGGRIAALAQETGRLPKDLIDPRTDEDVLTALFNERVLKMPPIAAPLIATPPPAKP